MPRIPDLCLALLVAAQPVQASDCANLAQLESYQSDRITPDGANCSSYRTQAGQTATSCAWEFPFRDKAAVAFADTLWSALQSYRAGSQLGPDTRVNHPDSYDLKTWVSEPGTFAISVKDKGQLNRTYVFLRFEPKTAD